MRNSRREVRLEVYRDALQYAVPAGRAFRSAAYNQIRDQLIKPIFADLFEGNVTVQEALRGMKQPMQALVDEALSAVGEPEKFHFIRR